MLTRRAFVASAAAFATLPARAATLPAPRPFRHFFPRVRFRFTARACIEAHRIIQRSDWRYQSLAEADDERRGVIQHLPSGFAFHTLPNPRIPQGSPEFAHEAICLFAPGDSLAKDYAARVKIGRAAAWVSTLIEDNAAGSFYVPRGYTDPDAELERPAAPFIAGEIPIGFLLRA